MENTAQDQQPTPKFSSRHLKALGCESLASVLLRLPKGYRDCSTPTTLKSAMRSGVPAYLVLKVHNRYDKRNSSPPRISFKVTDKEGTEGWVTIFGNTFPFKNFNAGDDLHLYGNVKEWNDQPQMNSPVLVPQEDRGRMAALYRGIRGRVAAETMSFMAREALSSHLDEAVSMVTDAIGMDEGEIRWKNQQGMGSIRDIIASLHSPINMKDAYQARLSAKKLAVIQIKAAAARIKNRAHSSKSVIKISWDKVASLADKLPYPLTDDQKAAIREIVEDLRSDMPMRRLLSGDVGTGKSLTFMIPAVAAHAAGAAVCIMTPNILLARQVVNEMGRFFPGIPVHYAESGKRIKKDNQSILVGTTGVITAVRKAGRSIDFLVCDEQHKLSREQRESLIEGHSNYLEATATAIPRSMALITHGGMDVSVLRASPVQKDIRTRYVTRDKMREMFDFLIKVMDKGGQVAIVYPRVEDSDDQDKLNIEHASEWWKKKLGSQVGTLHGRMSQEDKIDVMDKMLSKDYRLLITSTVIEVGVTIPSLRAVLVIEPHHYGTSQLHQLRGRLAREGGVGYMFMLEPDEEMEEETIARLRLVESEKDGFALAEKDMELRGFGDLSEGSDSQSGNSMTLFVGLKLKPSDMFEAAIPV